MKKKLLALLLSVSMLATEAGYADISVLADGVADRQSIEYLTPDAGKEIKAEVSGSEGAILTIASQGEGTYTFQQAISAGEATPGDGEFRNVAEAAIVSAQEGTVLTKQEGQTLPGLTIKDDNKTLAYVVDGLKMNTTYYFRALVQQGQNTYRSTAKVKTAPSATLQALMDKLRDAIKKACEVDETKYNDSQIVSLNKAISDGEAVLLKEGDISSEVSQAEATLQAAIENTKGEGTQTGVDKKDLEDAIKAAEAAIKDKSANDFVTSVFKAFPDAITAAKAVFDNEEASQADVNKAKEDLIAATNALNESALDPDAKTAKTALADELTAANAKIKDVTEPADAVAAYTAAIALAQKAYNEDKKADGAKQYTDATTALKAAGTAFDVAVAKVALKKVIDAANEAVKNEAASAEAKATLNTAITTAQGVYDKADATVEQVKKAADDLQAAIDTFNNALPSADIKVSAIAEGKNINVSFTGVSGATEYTIERAEGTGEFAKLSDVVLTEGKAKNAVYSEDFKEGIGGFESLVGAELSNQDGVLKTLFTGSGCRSAQLSGIELNGASVVNVEFDVKFDATNCMTNNPAAVSFTGGERKGNVYTAVTDQVLTVAAVPETTEGNQQINAWKQITVNGVDIADKALVDGKADWMKVSAEVDFGTKKVDVTVTSLVDGTELFKGQVDFIHPETATITGIYVQAGRGSSGTFLDNIDVSKIDTVYSFTDSNVKDQTEYSYKVSTTVDGKTHTSNVAKVKADFASVDKSELRKAIAEAETKKQADYTAESWADFATALTNAKAMLDKADATQDEVNAAVATLTTAITNLKPVGGQDSSEVQEGAKPKKNQTFVVSGVTYKVTSATAVTYVKTTAKSKKAAVTIPNVVKTPKNDTRYDKQYTMKVTAIADKAFQKSKVTKVTMKGANLKTIGKNAFANSANLTTVVIGKNLTTINASAFAGCKKLATVSGTNTKLQTIGASAFKGCAKLKTLPNKNVLPDTVKTIGASAFQGCKILAKIQIGKTSKSKLTSIGKSAFNGDAKLAKITITSKALKAKKVGSKAFTGIKKATIYYNKKLKNPKKVFTKATGVKGKVKIKVNKKIK